MLKIDESGTQRIRNLISYTIPISNTPAGQIGTVLPDDELTAVQATMTFA